jgi:hypothetical protein
LIGLNFFSWNNWQEKECGLNGFAKAKMRSPSVGTDFKIILIFYPEASGVAKINRKERNDLGKVRKVLNLFNHLISGKKI